MHTSLEPKLEEIEQSIAPMDMVQGFELAGAIGLLIVAALC